jgi:hypothetical protein
MQNELPNLVRFVTKLLKLNGLARGLKMLVYWIDPQYMYIVDGLVQYHGYLDSSTPNI